MVSATDVLIVWLVLGSIVSLFIHYKDELSRVIPSLGNWSGFESWNVKYVLVTWRTQKGKDIIENLSKKPFLGIIGNSGVVLIVTLAISSIFYLGLTMYVLLTTSQETAIQNPKNFLVIPGVNDFLPLSETPAIVIALLVAMIAHEFAHGVYCRYNDIEIDSLGFVLVSMIPMGAFVDPEEESQEEASIKGRLQMVSAGVASNFVLFLISLALLFVLASTVVSPVSGGIISQVYPNSSAEDAGISSQTIIVEVNGTEVENTEQMLNEIERSGGTLTLVDSKNNEYEVNKKVLAVSSSGPLDEGTTILSVNNEMVMTSSEFEDIVSRNKKVTIKKEDCNCTEELWIGAYGEDGEESIIVTEIEGERIVRGEDTTNYSGVVNATFVRNDELVSETINLGKYTFYAGISGAQFVDIGIRSRDLESQHSALSGEEGFLSGAALTLFGPFLEAIGSGESFSGFISEGIYYDYSYPVLFLMSTLFWSAFINVNLMIFNAIPSAPLDGGFVAKYIGEYISSKISEPEGEGYFYSIGVLDYYSENVSPKVVGNIVGNIFTGFFLLFLVILIGRMLVS